MQLIKSTFNIFHPLSFTIVIFVSITLWLSINNPIFEGPDENEHFIYMTILAKDGHLPIYSPDETPEQKLQPPLYYAIGSLFAGWVAITDLDSYLERNPHASVSRVHVLGNKNTFVHPPNTRLLHGTALAVTLFRFVSIGFATSTIIATYLISCHVFKNETWLALGATAIVAFNPQFVYISSVINTDNAVTAFSTIGLLLAIQIMQGYPSYKRIVVLGVVIGCASLTKVTGLALLPIGAIAITVVAWRERSLSFWLQGGILLAFTTGMVSGWWYIRNWQLHGDPLLTTLWIYHYNVEPKLETLGDWLLPFIQAEVSYWATFGWLSIGVHESYYQAIRLFDRIGLLGLIWFSLTRSTCRMPAQASPLTDEFQLPMITMLVSWAILIFAGLTNYVRIFGGLQGRHYFPMIASLSILLFVGWLSLIPKSLWTWFSKFILILFPSVCILLMVYYLMPSYTPPPIITHAQIPLADQQPNRYLMNTIRLLGGHVQSGTYQPGEHIPITLYWQPLKQIETNYSIYVSLLDHSMQSVGQHNSYPAQGLRPTRFWHANEVIADQHFVQIDGGTTAPMIAKIEVGMYKFENRCGQQPPILDEFGQKTNGIIGMVKIIPKAWSDENYIPLHVQFDDNIQLAGFNTDCTVPFTSCQLVLYWQPTGHPTENYTVFVQLWHETKQVAGFDRLPLNGNYPTTWWEASETIKDSYTVNFTPHVGMGVMDESYHLFIGLYRFETGTRLRIRHAGSATVVDEGIVIIIPRETNSTP